MGEVGKCIDRKGVKDPGVEESSNQASQRLEGEGRSPSRILTSAREREAPEREFQHMLESNNQAKDLDTSDMMNDELREALAISRERQVVAEARLTLAMEKNAPRQSTDPFLESDDVIVGKMEDLRHSIEQWSRNLSQGLKKPGLVKKTLKAFQEFPGNESPFQKVTTYWKEFLDEEKVENGASKLVQSYVWRSLWIDVFDVERQVWLGGQCMKGPGGPTYCPIYEPFHKMNTMIFLMTGKRPARRIYRHWLTALQRKTSHQRL